MTHRGRGTLEVKPSSNPFFQTTNSDIGIKPHESITWKVKGKMPPFNSNVHEVDGNFSFLYTRTSDDIGSKVTKAPAPTNKLLTKTEFLKKKREMVQMNKTNGTDDVDENNEIHDFSNDKSSTFKRTAEDILAVYQHAPKAEDPRYTTSTSEYGKKAPSVATIVVDRCARPQSFSKSFNNIKPQNTSLTTAVSRSTVHKSLDPQFA
eukprot:gene6145-8472_t